MTSPAATQPSSSAAPIWIALAIGLLVLLLFWRPYALYGIVPLVVVVSVIVFLARRSTASARALLARNEALATRVAELERDLAALTLEVRIIAARRDAGRDTHPVAAETPVAQVRPPAVAPAAAPVTGTPAPELLDAVLASTIAAAAPAQPSAAAAFAGNIEPVRPVGIDTPAAPAAPSPIERAVAAARAWLLGGNTVARIGLLILFVGVAFLLRYVAEHTRVPIEARLLAVAVAALVFLGLGWRLRGRSPGFAITLQGGAVGILYLTAFAALRLYAVLPPLAAFVFMALLAALSGVLAVMQNARALAALGAAGGFLAPLLVSTGEGRIALLFAYYLLLNAGVLGIAWFRAWRELNWIAFVATFGVSGLWAVRRYTPEDFALGQGFLIAFWLLFLVVSLLYALRQRDRTRGMFDTTLVFALPLAAFGVQTRFTAGLQLALASTVAAAVYLGVSFWLLRRRDAAFVLLTEACFALGVGFLTLAIPLAASAQWTAAAWALEGLALLWVGLRQGRVLPFAAGGLLHVLGAVALLRALAGGDVSLAPQWSGFTVNLAVFAAAAFVSAHLLARGAAPTAALQAVFARLPWLARAIGWAWVTLLIWQPLAFPWYVFAWCAAALVLLAVERRNADANGLTPEWVAGVALIVLAAIAAETRFAHDGTQMLKLLLRLALAATAVTAALLSVRSADAMRRTAAAALLTLGVLAWLAGLLGEAFARVDAPLAVAQIALALIGLTAIALGGLGTRMGWAWPQRLAWGFFAAHLVFAGYVVLQAIFAATSPSRHYGWALWPLAWALFVWRLRAEEHASIRVPAPGALHVAGLWLATAMLAGEAALRLDRFAGDGWSHAAWGAACAVALWYVAHDPSRWPMRAVPSAYARVGAPGLALFGALWLLAANAHTGGDPAPLPAVPVLNPMDLASLAVVGTLLRWHMAAQDLPQQRWVRLAIAAAAFLAINVIALRAVHFTRGVGWNVAELGGSLVVQAVLSLVWTVTAMGLMLLAHRRALRQLWLAGAVLLAAVVLKLFVVDLSGQGTIERIVSFVGVGLLILLIGYLAPVPPAAANTRSAEAS